MQQSNFDKSNIGAKRGWGVGKEDLPIEESKISYSLSLSLLILGQYPNLFDLFLLKRM